MGRIWAWSYLPRAASIVHGRSFQRENFERTVMNRRRFLTATAVGAGAGISSVAMPAIAQSMPQIRWRLAASWPKSLDTLYGACEVFAKRVAEITDNRFQIQLFAAGEIVPGLAVLDAVKNQPVEIGNPAAYYYVGKDAALAFGTAVPFGLNARQMESWLVHGGGNDLLQESFNCYGIPMGNTGSQMGGWFRKEINKVEDLQGLKVRIGGFAGQIISRLGVVPQQLAPGDIYRRSKKALSTRWSGSDRLTTRSSVSTRSRNTITTPPGGRVVRTLTPLSTWRSGMNCPKAIRLSCSQLRAMPATG